MKVSEETKIQIDFVDFCKEYYPELLVMHIPNEGKRTKINGYILKRMGLIAGVPDIFIPIKNLWIEFKSKKGAAKKNQIKMHKKLSSAAHSVFTCRSVQDAVEILNHYFDDAKPNFNEWIAKGKYYSEIENIIHKTKLTNVNEEDLLF